MHCGCIAREGCVLACIVFNNNLNKVLVVKMIKKNKK